MAAPTWCFSGYCWSRDESSFQVIGAPLEETVTYRPGTRFAPRAIREASAYIEYWSLRAGLDVDEEVKFYDAGDVPGEQPIEKHLEELAYTVERLYDEERPLVILGGEHTVTLGVIRGLVEAGAKPCILHLDAHLDMRSEYMGRRLSHATFMRLVLEEVNPRLVTVGYRAVVREELEYARSRRVGLVDAYTLEEQGWASVAGRVTTMLEECNHLHVTLDMDVFDPAYAPGVSNPEPEGASPRRVLDVVFHAARLAAVKRRSFSLDVVEVAPPYDCSGVTAALAAKAVVEAAAGYIHGARSRG